jgi:transcriptional regulator with XRE-family HTH domain
MIHVPAAATSPAMETFRANVRRAVDRGDISVSEIARRTGMSRPSLSRLLNSDEVVTIPRAEAIAKAVGVALSELLV